MTLPQPLYPGRAGSPATTISDPFVAGTDTTLKLADATVVPSAPNRITIIKADRSAFVTVSYASISGNTLSGVAYEEGTVGNYPAGSTAMRNFTARDQQALIQCVNYLESSKASSADVAGKQDTLVSGTNIKTINGTSVLGAGDITISSATAWGSISGTLSNQTDLQTALTGKVDKVSGSVLIPEAKITAYDVHVARADNPHSVDKAQVGLANVDNVRQYSATNPPPYPVTSVNGNTGAVTVEVPAKTSDLVNDAGFQTSAEVAYAVSTHNTNASAHTDIRTALDAKLGKQYTAAQDGYIAKVDSADHVLKVMAAGTSSVGFADITGQPSDNTNLNIALSGKVAIAQGVASAGKILGIGADGNVTAVDAPASAVWGSITGTLSNQSDLSTALAGKVDTVSGKQLSTEDYTSAEKTKLGGIEAGAQANVNADWAATEGDAQILNKPESMTPSAHAGTHILLGSDPIAIQAAQITDVTASAYELSHVHGVTSAIQTQLDGKQSTISAGNQVPSDYVSDTAQTHKFVSAAEKTTWNAKQNALTWDNAVTENSTNQVTSGTVYTYGEGIRTVANSKVAGVTLNGTSVVNASTKIAELTTVDNVTSTSQAPLSANQGKLLNDRINNLETRGKFLSLWNCTTGLPTTEPAATPYDYHTGDYFIISVVGASGNLMPNGSQYTGTASSTPSVPAVPQTGDIWRYDGTVWSFESNHSSSSGVSDVTVSGVSVVSAGTAVIPTASASVTGALSPSDWNTFNAKQKQITVSTSSPAGGTNGDIWIRYSQ